MLISNQMRFGADVFGEAVSTGGSSIPVDPADDTLPGGDVSYTVMKEARLEAKQPLDCSTVTNVDNFVFAGSQPSGTDRRIVFKIDDQLFKFHSGVLTAYTGKGNFSDVIKYGNTITELAALSDITGFVGKQIYPIIAMTAPEDSSPPKLKLWLRTRTVEQTTVKRIYSAAYTLPGDDVHIVDINAVTSTEGSGTVSVKCRLFADNAWGNWLSLDEAANQPANKIQFFYKLNVTTIDDDSATVESVTVNHTTGNAAVNGNVAELYSVVADCQTSLANAYLVVRHKKLIDSTIDAAVCFLPTPTHRDFVSLGNASGSRESFSLADTQIDHASLKVFLDGEQSVDFDFDCSAGTITLTAPVGSAVAASYDCNCGVETWQPLSRQSAQQPYGDDTFSSRFNLQAPVDDDRSRVAVKITLTKTTGHISRAALGKATGSTQYFVLPHRMTKLVVTKPADWSYNDANQLLTVVAPEGTNLAYAGNWQGEQPELYSFAAGFSC